MPVRHQPSLERVQLDAVGGTPAHPDSDVGIEEARRHERMVAQYLDGCQGLHHAGHEAARAVAHVCEFDRAPAGLAELEALRAGLQTLSAWWTAAKKRKSA